MDYHGSHGGSFRAGLTVFGAAVIVASISGFACGRHIHDWSDPEPPGAAMGCGIRGHMLNTDGTPELHAEVVAASLDQRSHVAGITDEMGRFALTTDCRRLYGIAVHGPVDIASTWVWVADAPVDVEVSTPVQGIDLAVKVKAPEDAARMRIFAIVPPTMTRPSALTPDECAARADKLLGIAEAAGDEGTRQLTQVAALDSYCGGCPDPQAAAALVGTLTYGRGIAEAWSSAYGRLFACTPGVHPHEADFEVVLGELHPEIAAMVVFGRIVEAEGRLDSATARRLWAKLRMGPLADTDFVRGLKKIRERGA